MPKKKKQSKKKTQAKKKQPEKKQEQVFWPVAGAILLFVVAFFILLGGFDSGGPLPQGMFNGSEWAFGTAAYVVPFALSALAVWKIRSESHKIPLQEFFSVVSFLVVLSAWLHVTFPVESITDRALGRELSRGGEVGSLVGDIVLQALNTVPASVLLFVVATLLFLLSLRLSPMLLINWITKQFERTKKHEDGEYSELSALKKKSGDSGFTLRAGVPVEDKEDAAKESEQKPKHTSFKNTAQQLSKSETHEALTIASDPDWKLPEIELLNQKEGKANAGDVNGNAELIQSSLANFNIDIEMDSANIGPRVTQYRLRPPTGVKLTKITALENNLALDLAATAIRIEAPIPGKRLVGIEVPNKQSATVRVSGILKSPEWKKETANLAFAVGKDISGKSIVLNLAKMPHLLVAGQTGSGKSVMINAILTSLMYRNSPADLKFILVDPKFVELKTYNDIPHLLTPVITEPEKCISALKWAVAEMERRLRTLSEANASNIDEYNASKHEEGMPFIVIVIDELSDLMMMAARDVEQLIVRLAQKSRAAGIHLVLATQRPSVNVITGLIKANIPARIAFTVNSHVDSKTILDMAGAEKLLGTGDMLFTTAEMPKPRRAQGALINKDEVIKVTDFLREQRHAEYDDEIVSQSVQLNGRGGVVADIGGTDADDDMYKDAVGAVIQAGKASTSMLQRRLRIGYGRAARLIETMEEQGIVGPADGSKAREVLVASIDEINGPAQSQDDVYGDMPDEDEYAA